MKNTAAPPKKLSAMRSMIARKMVESLQNAAQISYHAELDARALVAARSAWRAKNPRISYEDIIIEVLVGVLRDHPLFNATFGNSELQVSDAVHVSVAIALPNALVAPAVFDAQSKSLAEIADARSDLVARARLNKLTLSEMTEGTITISNMGLSRTRFFTPILNVPQIAIIGLGQIVARPWVSDDQLIIAPVMGLSLTTDHRILDGQPSGAFLTSLCEALESVEGPL